MKSRLVGYNKGIVKMIVNEQHMTAQVKAPEVNFVSELPGLELKRGAG